MPNTCKCRHGFELEGYCLQLGTLRVEGASYASLIRTFWLVLQRSACSDGVHSDSYKRIGLGFKTWSSWEPSNFHLFEDAQEVIVKII